MCAACLGDVCVFFDDFEVVLGVQRLVQLLLGQRFFLFKLLVQDLSFLLFEGETLLKLQLLLSLSLELLLLAFLVVGTLRLQLVLQLAVLLVSASLFCKNVVQLLADHLALVFQVVDLLSVDVDVDAHLVELRAQAHRFLLLLLHQVAVVESTFLSVQLHKHRRQLGVEALDVFVYLVLIVMHLLVRRLFLVVERRGVLDASLLLGIVVLEHGQLSGNLLLLLDEHGASVCLRVLLGLEADSLKIGALTCEPSCSCGP